MASILVYNDQATDILNMGLTDIDCSEMVSLKTRGGNVAKPFQCKYLRFTINPISRFANGLNLKQVLERCQTVEDACGKPRKQVLAEV